MKTITLQDAYELCNRFKVDFSITTSDGLMFYHFGDQVKWAKPPFESFSFEDYWEVSLRLAATYPNKIIHNLPDEAEAVNGQT